MNDERLMSQLIKGLEEGYSRERVKISLLASGWSASAIEEAFQKVESSPMQNIRPRKPRKYFKILLSVILLSAVIYVFIQIAFQVEVMPIIVSPQI